MRNLVILRGAPGCGKSTWIKENNLENYTLSADDIRMLFQSPVQGLEHEYISQENDNDVWALLFELLEKRMARGEFVVIDATHSRRTDFSQYNKLCAKYRYRRFFIDFSDVPMELCKEQNKKRPVWKQVPDLAIEKVYSRLRTQPKTSGWVELDKNNIWETLSVKCLDFDKYENIHIFGDIHGCYSPIEEYFEKYPYSEKDFYIFCGDYLDRGIQNKEVLEFLIDFSKRDNFYCLTGNHEEHLSNYANDEEITSREFKHNTLPQIIDIDTKEIREFCRKLGQMAYFSFKGKKYFVTHAGLSYMPDNLCLTSTETFIKGVGDYTTDIDEIWANFFPFIVKQVHAHRNVLGTDGNEYSYNLEGNIEHGGDLRVLQLPEEKIIKIKNTVIRTDAETPMVDIPILKQLQLSEDVVEKDLGDNIHSFNFSRKVFYKNTWNELNTHARGLFVDIEKKKIVARSYEKFFNVGQRREDELISLLKKFKGKTIKAYRKENGYLGLLSMANGELFFASKSTNKGDYVDWFKNIFNCNDYIKDFLRENDVTLVFEVIDPVNDPHIIKYDKPECVLLDIVKNDWEFYKYTYEELKEFSEKAGLKCKEIYKDFEDEKEFYKWYLENTKEDDLSKEDIEGVVIEAYTDPHKPYMTKIKFPYYNFWKQMRGVADKVNHKKEVKLSSLYLPLSNYFYAWLLEQDNLDEDIITLRDKFTKEN